MFANMKKALVASAVAFVGSVGVALSDGRLTSPEAMVSLGAALIAFAGTYKATNTPRTA